MFHTFISILDVGSSFKFTINFTCVCRTYFQLSLLKETASICVRYNLCVISNFLFFAKKFFFEVFIIFEWRFIFYFLSAVSSIVYSLFVDWFICTYHWHILLLNTSCIKRNMYFRSILLMCVFVYILTILLKYIYKVKFNVIFIL